MREGFTIHKYYFMGVKVIWDELGLEKQEFAHIYGTSRRDCPLSY
jgi:DNA-binding transcriptional regulator YiaG